MRYAAALLAVAALASCASEEGDALTVFAASSLEVAFADMAAAFEEAHPGTEVTLSLAGSQTLATQIVNGAQPDVFASADHRQMERVAGFRPPDVGPVEFAANRLAIAVAQGNPEDIGGLADLARDDVRVALGAEEVPVGRYGRQALSAAGVQVDGASLEPNAGLALTKVALGEVDAALVYRSDIARAEGDVDEVPIPPEENVAATYPIAGWNATDRAWAERFVEFVSSPAGREALVEAGFEP